MALQIYWSVVARIAQVIVGVLTACSLAFSDTRERATSDRTGGDGSVSISLRPNEPKLLASGALGDPSQGALVHDDTKGEYVLIGGSRGSSKQPYDVVSFKLNERVWTNVFPFSKVGRWGPEVGEATAPAFSSDWWGLFDTTNFPRPHFRRWAFSFNAFQWTHTKATNQVFFLFGNHTIAYDIARRTWKYYTLPINPAGAPLAVNMVGLSTQRLMWSSLVSDAASRKLLLFGGTNTAPTNNGDIGTWIFDIAAQHWRKLEGTVPPRRAYSQMVTDADRDKVLLFGGDTLDSLKSDTWMFDFATEKWTELHPSHRPSPRFGHAMVFLPKSRQIVLWSGYEYNPSYDSNPDAPAYRYKLPLELWRWDWDRTDWRLIRAMPSNTALTSALGAFADPTAANSDDVLLFYRYLDRHNAAGTNQTWALRVDASVEDAPGTKANSVPDGAVMRRTGRYDPSWFAASNPASQAEKAAHRATIDNAPSNTWIPITTPNRPTANQYWGTVTIDPAGQKIYRWSGGHSSYTGTDVLEYDIQGNRFSISYRPELPLEWIGASSGTPGDVSFKGRPFLTAHSYKMYAFAPAFGKVVVAKSPYTYFYDPIRHDFDPNPVAFNFNDVRDNVMLTATRAGVVAWSVSGVFEIGNDGAGWKKIAQPFGEKGTPYRDNSSLVYDSTRERVLLFPAGSTSPGQVWDLNLTSGALTDLVPQGLAGMRAAFPSPEFNIQRMFRDAVYIPEQDVVLVPKMISATTTSFRVPVYDVAENRWYSYHLRPTSVAPLFTRGSGSASTSVTYDNVNKRVWALDGQARIWLLKFDKTIASKSALP
jgi:hypothetical protein